MPRTNTCYFICYQSLFPSPCLGLPHHCPWNLSIFPYSSSSSPAERVRPTNCAILWYWRCRALPDPEHAHTGPNYWTYICTIVQLVHALSVHFNRTNVHAHWNPFSKVTLKYAHIYIMWAVSLLCRILQTTLTFTPLYKLLPCKHPKILH